jgi:hypothetical protein
MSEQEQDLTLTIQELMAQMRVMQEELDSLKARAQVLPQPTIQSKPQVSTTRRKLLRRLAGGLVAGLAIGSIGASLPQTAEAKMVANPAGPGLTGRVGMLAMPPGSTVSGTLAGGSTKAGLLVGGDNPFDVSKFTPTVNAAILAYTSGNGSAIVGQTQTGTAVYGQSDSNYGVVGQSTSGIGTYGQSTSNYGVQGSSTNNHGIYGKSSGNVNYGVYGENTNYAGVYGLGAAIGVKGKATTYGVSGESDYIGVYGIGTTYGIYGTSTASGSQAGYFEGNVFVSGTINKSAVGFKIDHPLDPANKYLYHTGIESPDMMNIYNGLVTLDEQGEATVTMPDWFEVLNSDFRYQLTSIGVSMPDLYIAEKLSHCKFKIAGGKPDQEISWMITGIRQDPYAKAHRMPIEENKTGDAKGKYIHPELFGQPVEMAVHPRPMLGLK